MRTRGSTALVTGGLGYIGSYAVRELLDRGWRVRVLENNYRCDPEAAAATKALDGVELVEGDIRYASTVEKAMQNVEAVVHLAAVCMNKSIADPTESLDVNLMGTQNVLDAASRAGVRRFIYASSASIYGNPTVLPMRETDQPSPITPYCTAKLAGEHMLAFYARRSSISWLALRFFNVYGPGQPTDAYYTSVVLTFLNRIIAGEAPVIDGDGQQSMDFVHVLDVVRSIGLAVDSSASGEALNVGTGEQTTIAQLADALVKCLGADLTPIFRPREVLVTQREASIDRIQQVLGWYPQITFDEGIASVVDWHRSILGDAD